LLKTQTGDVAGASVNITYGRVRRIFFGLKPEETDFVHRGFRVAGDSVRARLESVGRAFVAGYHMGLEYPATANLVAELSSVDTELRGFAFEGAAMGVALLDCLTPWRPGRITQLLRGAGNAHAYMVHVGVGWAWARLPFGARRGGRALDPLLSWLAFDGWGFHEGFFHWTEYVGGRLPPRRLTGYEARVFDQGLGRSWWFVNGGNPDLIALTIGNFAMDRRADMWSGVGLAAVYAGIVSEASLGALRESAGPHRPHLAQGAAFAAKARQRAGNLTDYTDIAVRVLGGVSAREAAHLTDMSLENLPANAAQPAYEIWRQRIQQHFQGLTQIQRL
jgi:enediyne biosynthesis protein E3